MKQQNKSVMSEIRKIREDNDYFNEEINERIEQLQMKKIHKLEKENFKFKEQLSAMKSVPDLKIINGKDSYNVHKELFKNRSRVIADLLNSKNELDITDLHIEDSGLKIVIHYVYTGSIPKNVHIKEFENVANLLQIEFSFQELRDLQNGYHYYY
ncbi:hypothetical protein PVAND_016022 [Polypedilum vanderplanki]|uniref:BTB domain-containing protein n=1 Tax=Polypedilum vanderplanki TaxID=319348 RepID=A0A9J6BED8_POLVA|nr:hypothetical protein PVAND_016022 [Polypedilum vanderplanki]